MSTVHARRRGLLVVVCALMGACVWGRFPLESGTYQADSSAGSLAGALLVLDVEKMHATLTLGAQAPIELMFSRRQTKRDCYTNNDHAEIESWKIAPDPFVVADLSLPEAVLTTFCVQNAGLVIEPECKLSRSGCPTYGYGFAPPN